MHPIHTGLYVFGQIHDTCVYIFMKNSVMFSVIHIIGNDWHRVIKGCIVAVFKHSVLPVSTSKKCMKVYTWVYLNPKWITILKNHTVVFLLKTRSLNQRRCSKKKILHLEELGHKVLQSVSPSEKLSYTACHIQLYHMLSRRSLGNILKSHVFLSLHMWSATNWLVALGYLTNLLAWTRMQHTVPTDTQIKKG